MRDLRSPTVYEVAKIAGVSVATVSRVLNSPGQVREETRARVLAVIDQLGFYPNAASQKRIGRIGVITPFFTFPSFVQRARGVAEGLAGTDFELIIYPVETLKRLDGYLSTLSIQRRLDGLVVLSLPVSEVAAQRLVANGIETVLIEYYHPSLNSIRIDDQKGGVMAAEYLLSKGHRRCAFVISGELPEYSIHPEDLRLAGFRQALLERGIELTEDYIRSPALTGTGISKEISTLFDLPDPPTAVFAATDELAIRVVVAARERGINVPSELAVIGFDDIDMAELIGLTTISQSLDESGRMAAEMLLARICNPSRPVQHVQLQLKVVERNTV
jgi:LacI family transcriptional regulator, galactose operon repressor